MGAGKRTVDQFALIHNHFTPVKRWYGVLLVSCTQVWR
jgi:hypothetical protein